MSRTGGKPPPPDSGRQSSVLGRFRKPAPEQPGPERPTIDLDPVTGLPTRRHLEEWVHAAVKRSHASSTRTVVAFVGIGLLRDINDTYGADAGDDLLRMLGERLQTIDMPGTKVLRYEGAEFAVVLERVNHSDALNAIASFLVELTGRPVALGHDEVTIKPVVGAAISADNYDGVAEFIRDAHRALARARDTGSDWEVHDESKRGRYETRVDESRLHSALEDGEFVLVYQPIVTIEERNIVGFEAFVRWKAPGATNVGLLMPHDFMPTMEKTGMSIRLGEWILDEACRQLAEWRAYEPNGTPLFMTCNVSGRQLASDNFVAAATGAIERHGLHTNQLCLDITEGSLRFTGAGAWPVLRELYDEGVRIGLDDFGTGMSSLQFLLDFSLHYVRIASTFIRHLDSDSSVAEPAGSVIRHMAAMAAELDIISIAEGVESETQADRLGSLGLILGQGFHFGRPGRAESTLALLDPDAAESHEWDTSRVFEGDPPAE